MLAAAALATATGCEQHSDTPTREPSAIAATFASAIRACGRPLAPDGTIDQVAIARSGWQLQRRVVRRNAVAHPQPLAAHPMIAEDEYESTVWRRPDAVAELDLIRYSLRYQPDLTDSCSLRARATTRAGTGEVLAALERVVGHPAERLGELPRGGDFLTPRFDRPSTGYRWQVPGHEILLTVNGRDTAVEIKARPGAAPPQHKDHAA